MKKRKKSKNQQDKYLNIILFVILIILIVAIITMGIFSKKPKIIEIKTFSEIPGFSFEYPVFKGWAVSLVKKMNENEYQIFYSCSFGTAIAPSMRVEKNKYIFYASIPGAINPNKILYYLIEASDGNHIIFFDPKENFNVDIYPYAYEGDGYSEKVLTDKIIETFKFNNSPELESSSNAEYGKIVSYTLNKTIQFPDFNLKFTGIMETPGPNNAKWKFTYYNFEITDNETKNISWSSGTGEIGPTKFIIDKKIYYLELKQSIKYYPEWLKDNELVVLSKEQFDELRDK